MPSDFAITVFRRCAFLQIHPLQDRIFSILSFDGKHCLLPFAFTGQFLLFFRPFFLAGRGQRKQVELLHRLLFLSRGFSEHISRRKIEPPHQQIFVCNAFEQLCHCIHKLHRG